MEQPVKELILFHSLHASIYFAVWHGLFDTLEELSSKLKYFASIVLVAAELDYPITDYTTQIITSIKTYADEIAEKMH